MKLTAPNILLIGGSGQDSFYLARYLSLKGANITLLYRSDCYLISNLHSYANISLNRVVFYDFRTIYRFVDSCSFDYVVLIAGMVGNSFGAKYPYSILNVNLSILTATIQAISSSSNSPHLVYFSSTDICSKCSDYDDNQFTSDLANLQEPKTNYGLSKLICARLLESAHNELSLKYTILYLGMHESWQRKGDYVLSKIKDTILTYKETGVLRKLAYSNLDIFIDIGHAAEFMNLVAEILVNDVIKVQKSFNIGTSTHTSLFELCCDILTTYRIEPSLAIKVNRTQEKIYFPKISMDWTNDFKIMASTPSPMSGKLLHKYSQP